MIGWRGLLRRRRRRPDGQTVFAFVSRSRRRRRFFRAAIVAATATVVALIVAASPTARHGVRVAGNRARWAVLAMLGLDPPREEVEAEQREARRIGIDRTRAALAATYDHEGPAMRRLLEVARMVPESAVIRWANFDGTIVLSSDVFEPDDTGRSYRFRPNTRSIWMIGIMLRDAFCQFQLPDTPEARAAGAEAGGVIVPQSAQSTNSWGCRGPEPNVDAPLRGIVLGDSVIQGLLVGDDQTPPACLERELAARMGERTSVLNAGVLGYSTEQYYYTLEQFADRMKPEFIVVGLCGNDFGDWSVPGNWDEACDWLFRILQFCRTRQIVCLIVAWPGEDALLAYRDESIYPGQVSHRMKLAGVNYLYPLEHFTNEDLRLRVAFERAGKNSNTSPLYNRHLKGDNHMSPLGCALWGKVVAERLDGIMRRRSLGASGQGKKGRAPSFPGHSVFLAPGP